MSHAGTIRWVITIVLLSSVFGRSDGWAGRRRTTPAPPPAPPCTVARCTPSTWEQWSTCTATCGTTGTSLRSRSVAKNIVCVGSCPQVTSESRVCNRECCPVDCQLGEWSSWGVCSRSCGNDGTRQNTRSIITPALCNGTPCGMTVINQDCNRECCPSQCQPEDWSSWSHCLHGVCISPDSRCNYVSGYQGENFDQTCNEGFYGRGCSLQCNCRTSQHLCDPLTGQCYLPYERNGDRCENEIPCLFYGKCSVVKRTPHGRARPFLRRHLLRYKLLLSEFKLSGRVRLGRKLHKLHPGSISQV